MFEKALTEDLVESVSDNVPVRGDESSFHYDRQMDRKVLRRLDILVQPIMFIMFVFLLLDRANVGNARVAGMQKDLHLTDSQYQISLMVTFIPYILIEIPSNMVLKKIGPRWMLPGLCICWGVVTTFESLVQNYAGFVACRFFIGLCEGGVFPGFVVYLSEFYQKNEIQSRIALLYGAASIAGAFGGLLAAAIETMDGLAGLDGWRWIFLLEGLATVVFGFCALWVMPNGPEDALTLTAEQKEYYAKRVAANHQTTETSRVAVGDILACLKEPHFIIVAIISFFVGAVAQGIAYFTPSIVLSFGYGRTTTQLLTVPPFMFAFITTVIAGITADRYHCRGIVTVATASLGILGCILNYSGTSLAIRYPALFFLIGGIYSCAPTVIAWIPNNNAAYGKRSCAIAIGFMVSNCGGILGVWLYPSNDAPRYLFGTDFNISFLAGTLMLAIGQMFLLKYLNGRKIVKREELLRGVERLSLGEQIKQLGDHHPDFKYTL